MKQAIYHAGTYNESNPYRQKDLYDVYDDLHRYDNDDLHRYINDDEAFDAVFNNPSNEELLKQGSSQPIEEENDDFYTLLYNHAKKESEQEVNFTTDASLAYPI